MFSQGSEGNRLAVAAFGVLAVVVCRAGGYADEQVSFAGDLTLAKGVAFEAFCDVADQCEFRPSTLVLEKSGGTAYRARFTVRRAGEWCPVLLPKEAFALSGPASGWSDISSARVRNYRFSDRPFRFAVRNVRPWIPEEATKVAFLRNEPGTPRAADAADEYSQRTTWLPRLAAALDGVGGYMLSDADLRKGLLTPDNAAVVVIEGSVELTEKAEDALREYLSGNGAVIVWNTVTAKAVKRLCADFPEKVLFGRGAGRGMLLDPNLPPRETMRPYLAQALLRSFPGAKDEKRMICCHYPDGPRTGDAWDAAAAFLATNGVTDIGVNVCRGIYAAYPSKVLKPWPKYAGRDWLQECLSACRRHGVKMTAWRCCFVTPSRYLSAADKAELAASGRLAVGRNGQPVDFACPTHPDNVRLEAEAVAELAQKGVDGIDLDYIRYVNGGCFCPRCRAALEKQAGRPCVRWPQDVFDDVFPWKEWEKFMCANVNRVVREATAAIRQANPKVLVSVSGQQDPQFGVASVGQDWPLWCREGWIDEVGVMDYVEGADVFSALMRAHGRLDTGRVAIKPIVGMSCWANDGLDAVRVAEQVRAARRQGYGAWSLFEYDRRAKALYPELGLGR